MIQAKIKKYELSFIFGQSFFCFDQINEKKNQLHTSIEVKIQTKGIKYRDLQKEKENNKTRM